MADNRSEGRRRITLELSLEHLAHIDALKKEWGLRNRGDVLERLLEELFLQEDRPEGSGDLLSGPRLEEELDEQAALVLVGRDALDNLGAEFEARETPAGRAQERRSGGIDLPGFVQKRTEQIRRDLRPERERLAAPLPPLASEDVQRALEEAHRHWLDLYGTGPNEIVLEAAMIWLSQDIWPQADQSEGRGFTWSGVCRALGEQIPAWNGGPPTFERVMVAAGILEDPFSAATLSLRIPTLIHRFVHRFRRRRRGTSFQTLEHTMTLQGALRLLQLPTDPGHRLTLSQIREAYRQLALDHHPDSGGSAETMRRLNEAYQLLKELYRTRSSTPTMPPIEPQERGRA